MNLPQSTCDRYQTLLHCLDGLQESCLDNVQTSGELDRQSSDPAIALHSNLQSQFQALLAALHPPERQQLQRYNTEIFKELQLLGPDLIRLSLLKPGTKQEQLLERIIQRCDRLRGYISTLLEASSSDL